MAKITTSNLNNTLNSRITAGETALAAVANVVSLAITSVEIANSSYAVLDDTAANTSGTSYLVVNGSGFNSNCIVIVGATNASSTTFANSKQLRAAVAAQNAASYPVYVTDTVTGATATKINGLTFSSFPVWGTATELANVLSNTVFSTLLSANSDSSIVYSNTTILPTGTILLSNGYFYGNISIGESSATYSFDVKATDVELQDQSKTFNLSAINVPPAYTVEYLVIAGGGGGGSNAVGGGGGAGGLLSGSTSLTSGTSYPITVGGGGAVNTNGNQSSFAGINSTGGGGGSSSNGGAGQPGGSGGGGSGGTVGPSGNPTGGPGGSSTPGQGNGGGGGGNASVPLGNWGGGGGGGGRGGSGTPGGNATPSSATGGPGGAGSTWPFTGSTYAGGGGGTGTGPQGSGGSGGGGPAFNPGSNNTGGGGGGQAGAGGSGVVILAVPTPNYPGSAPGATVTTPPAAPGKTVVTFTSSGTYTA